MIIKLHRALLKRLPSAAEQQSGLCRSRPISTKSAIHAALKSRPRDGFRSGRMPRESPDSPRSQTSMQRGSSLGRHLEERKTFKGDYGEMRQKVSRPPKNFQDSRSKRSSDIYQEPRGLRRSGLSTRGDDLRSYASAPHFRESRGSGRRDGGYTKAFESAPGIASPSKPSQADTWSSLDEMLPNEEPSEPVDTIAPQRGASRSELPRRSEKDFIGNSRYDVGARISDQDSGDIEPLRLPYTTTASEFLYGRSVVAAALRAQRRKFYKLYIYQSPKREADKNDLEMRKMALKLSVPVERVSFDKLQMLDRMSEGRPHNGFILETSPLPKPPITGFDRIVEPAKRFLAFLDYQSREDEAINGSDPRVKYNSPFPRFPFVLLLDGILDPQNLGAALRSAFFLGVDALVLTTNRTAPLSPVALKASAGASEAMPIFTTNQTRPFLDACKSNGWKVYASTAAPSSYGKGENTRHRHLTTSTLVSDVSRRPCILIMGSEGQGLYKDVQGAADNTVSIEGPRRGEMGIDSLNVSVATGLLCETFLRKPARSDEHLPATNQTISVESEIGNRVF